MPETKRLVGSDPNQVPRNKDLGTLAFQYADAVSIVGGVASLSTLTTTGNVGIGTAAPVARLEVARGSEGEYLRVGGDNATNARGLRFTSSTAGVSNGALHTINAASAEGVLALATNSTERLRIASGGDVTINGGNLTMVGATPMVAATDSGSALRFGTGAGGTERLRIDSSGSINVATAGARITADFSNGTVVNRVMFQTNTTNGVTILPTIPNGTATQSLFRAYNNSTPTNASYVDMTIDATVASINSNREGSGSFLPLTFGVNNSERARITTAGDFLIGRSNTTNIGSNTNTVAGTAIEASGYAHMARNSAGSKLILQDTTNRTGTYATFVSGSAITGSIDTNGTTTAFTTTSDERLKSNIAPAGDAGPLLDQIEVVQYDWTHNNAHEPFGLIAQALNTIRPQAVVVGDDDEENIQKVWGVDYSKLVPLLIKEVQSLRARVAALEGN